MTRTATEQALLTALHHDPADDTARLALADWLDEEGRAAQAELLRLHVRQRHRTGTWTELERLCRLLQQGTRPAVPELTNSIGMRLVLIPAGRFRMGSPADDPDRDENEPRLEEVEVTAPFYLGAFQVTQAQYQRVAGHNPSAFRPGGPKASLVRRWPDTGSLPAESVSWDDAVAFCQALSAMPSEAGAGRVYRLPTEAEWEYACRGGAAFYQDYHFGDVISTKLANYNHAYPQGWAGTGPYPDAYPRPVGSYPPNAFGLFDMHGNVAEWCDDWHQQEGAEEATQSWAARGGSWYNPEWHARSASRCGAASSRLADASIGLRVLCEVPSSR